MRLGGVFTGIIVHSFLWVSSVPSAFLCASSCFLKHEGCLSLCSLFAILPSVSSVSLAALRHSPSPLSLHEYLTAPRASVFSTSALLFPCFLSYSLSYLFCFCNCCFSLSTEPLVRRSCLLFASFVSFFLIVICSCTHRGWGEGGGYNSPCPLTPRRCFLFNLFQFIEFNYF